MHITPIPNRRIRAAMWRSRLTPLVHASGPPGMKLLPGHSMVTGDRNLFLSARARLDYLIFQQHARIARRVGRKSFLGTPSADPAITFDNPHAEGWYSWATQRGYDMGYLNPAPKTLIQFLIRYNLTRPR